MVLDQVRVAASAINQVPMDWLGNLARVCQGVDEAKDQQVELLVFPELCLSGYNCEDMFFSLHTVRMVERSLAKLLEYVAKLEMILVVGMPLFHRGAMYNAAVVIQNGKILGVNPKKQLPREGVHYESRWFQPGYFGQKDHLTLLGRQVPFGDYRYQIGNFCFAIEICEEAWRSPSGASEHARSGAELVLNPSASHFAFGKYEVREALLKNNSRACQVHYVHANLLGLEAGRMIYDGGSMIVESGQVMARGPRFGFKEGYLCVYDLDLDLARVDKLRNRSEMIQGQSVRLPPLVNGELIVKKPRKPLSSSWKLHPEAKALPLSKEEEFLAAQMQGLFDYLRKSRAKGFVLSLSGGCDSSSVAVLAAQMIACALKELGPKDFAQKLGIKSLPKNPDLARSWIQSLLTLAYQSTDHSSETTRSAARNLALELGAEFHEFSIQDVVKSYTAKAEKALSRPLTWEQDDLSLQNIQARARAPMIWLLANLKNALLLATSNKSEVALGYATMDGDTAGGLAPLGGIDKHFLRQWLRWAEKDCEWGLGPLSALRDVNAQSPTAELRPKDRHQVDEHDLMPYEILARIEILLIKELMSPQDILARLGSEFSGYGGEQLKEYLKRFLRLFAQNQWKRERYAPAFFMGEESLDPKSWCRFPILSGGFSYEAEELELQIGEAP